MLSLPYSKIHAFVSMVTSAKDGDGNPAVLNDPNPLLNKVEWCR
jgi:hypothetical protein